MMNFLTNEEVEKFKEVKQQALEFLTRYDDSENFAIIEKTKIGRKFSIGFHFQKQKPEVGTTHQNDDGTFYVVLGVI
jgi:uncharacterized protein YjgD (DUF1641 family)